MTSLAQAIIKQGKSGFQGRNFQYGKVEAVHARASTTLYASAVAGANSIQTEESVATNSLVVITLKGASLAAATTSLASALIEGDTYTSLALDVLDPLPTPVSSGDVLVVAPATGEQVAQFFTVSADADFGATSVSVDSQVATESVPAGTLVTLPTHALADGVSYSELNVNEPIVAALLVGDTITLSSGDNSQNWTVAAATPAMSTLIPVDAQEANADYPALAQVAFPFTINSAPLLVQSSIGSGAPYTVVLSGPLLTSALTEGDSYTSLAITALPAPVPSGSSVTLMSGSDYQNWTLTEGAASGATSLSVVSQEANASYAVGTPVTPTGLPWNGSNTPTCPYFQLGRQLPGSAASGATVMTVPTIDCYLDGAQIVPRSTGLPNGTGTQKKTAQGFLTTGIRYLDGFDPVVGNVAVILWGSGLSKTDRIAIGRLA